MYVGLFTHFDKIVKYNRGVEGFLKKRGFFRRFLEGYEEGGKEFLISREEYETLRKLKGKRRIGGNAGNAAQFLSFNKIDCVLSCPIRPKSLMKMLGKNVYVVCNGKIVKAKNCLREDPEIEHIIIEKGNTRIIFTYDPIAMNFILDGEFWNFVKENLFLSGFHVIPTNKKNLQVTKQISDILEDKKITTWVELGEPMKNIKEHIKVLIKNEFVKYIGMNEKETRIFSDNLFEVPKVLYEGDKFCFIHSKNFWILSSEEEINRETFIEISKKINFWAVGKRISNVFEIKKISRKPLIYLIKIRPFKKLKRATGLGDCVSVMFFYYLTKINNNS